MSKDKRDTEVRKAALPFEQALRDAVQRPTRYLGDGGRVRETVRARLEQQGVSGEHLEAAMRVADEVARKAAESTAGKSEAMQQLHQMGAFFGERRVAAAEAARAADAEREFTDEDIDRVVTGIMSSPGEVARRSAQGNAATIRGRVEAAAKRTPWWQRRA